MRLAQENGPTSPRVFLGYESLRKRASLGIGSFSISLSGRDIPAIEAVVVPCSQLRGHICPRTQSTLSSRALLIAK